LNYLGGASAATIDGSVTVSDLDNTTQASGTVSITSGFHSGDTLAFTNTSATTFGNISVSSYNAGTGVLTLTSSGATATKAQWASAFSAVTFSAGTSVTPGNRTISFVVNDGTVNSAAATDTVAVTAPPIVTTSGGSAAFTAGDNTASTPVAIDSGLTVTDASTSTLTSATVSITGNFHSAEDVLAFTSGAPFGNIAGSYNSGTGVLTLTSSGNTATLAQWNAALEAVTYTDTAVTPNNATRTISFSVADANSNTSNTATRTVTVTDTDQTPIVTTTGGTTLNYLGGASAATIDGSVTVSDSDNATQASGTVSITTGFHSGDTLALTGTYGNISVSSYNAGTGVLTLTSSGATATKAQWASAFSAVTFSAGTSATPGNRTISFVVNDGTKSSAAATDTVAVTAPPIVTTSGGSAAFTAGDNTASTPVTIDSGLTVTDASTSTLTSATVSITGNFHSGEDVLGFTNNPGTMGNIAGSYNSGTGVLTLTSAGNTATLAQWQAAMRAVTYTDTAVTPNNATRTISFSVTDANSNASNTATRTVTVADTDQTPIVTTAGSTTGYLSGASATAIDGSVTVSDLDNNSQASGTVSIGTGFHAGDTLAFTNDGSTMGNIIGSYNSGTGVLTLTSSGATATNAQWQAVLRAVTFSSSSTSYGNRTISFVDRYGQRDESRERHHQWRQRRLRRRQQHGIHTGGGRSGPDGGGFDHVGAAVGDGLDHRQFPQRRGRAGLHQRRAFRQYRRQLQQRDRRAHADFRWQHGDARAVAGGHARGDVHGHGGDAEQCHAHDQLQHHRRQQQRQQHRHAHRDGGRHRPVADRHHQRRQRRLRGRQQHGVHAGGY
jgi:hypothetical protein